MKDSFNNEIRENMIVEIKNAFFATDNARYVVDYVTDYRGEESCCLLKLNKNNTKSKSNYSVCHWPLMSFVSDREKTIQANKHNKEHATIQVLGEWVEPEKKPVSNDIRFTKTGIKKGETYCSVFYDISLGSDNKRIIHISARHYHQHIPSEIGNVRNDSDIMTDYFEHDRCSIPESSKYFKPAFEACKKAKLSELNKRLESLDSYLLGYKKKFGNDDYRVIATKHEIEGVKNRIALFD